MRAYYVKPRNYYGFNHEVVRSRFEGDLHYINDFVFGENSEEIWAVYKSKKPNTAKGHKSFMILKSVGQSTDGQPKGVVGGVERDVIDENRYRAGVYCRICQNVIVSLHRHDFVSCPCKAVSVDGGGDFFKISSQIKCWDSVDVDLLNGIAKTIDKDGTVKRGLWHTIKTFLSNTRLWIGKGSKFS